ncbi:MAG: NfeD family protein [Flammeovirgaceae bacterium]
MEWITIAVLIALGLVLIVIEILFVPGTTVVGFVGFALMLVGVALTFSNYGRQAGWIVLGGSAVGSGLIVYFTLSTKTWERFALQGSIKSRVNEGDFEKFKVGEEGVTVSALRPVGKAEINEKIVEVRSEGEYIDANSSIRIQRVVNNQIIVKLV